MHVQKILQQIVHVPRAARHVEDRVELPALPSLQGMVEGGHAFEWEACVSVVEEHYPRHLHEARNARLHHCIVEVADHAEPRPRGDERTTDGPRPGLPRPQEFDLDRMPHHGRVWWGYELEVQVEETLLVGHRLQLVPVEISADASEGDLVAREPADHVTQVGTDGVARARPGDGPLFQDPSPSLKTPLC